MSKKVKFGLEVLLFVVILGLIYKLATGDASQEATQNAVASKALSEQGISAETLSVEADAPMPKMQDAQAVADRIMQESMQSGGRNRINYNDLNQ